MCCLTDLYTSSNVVREVKSRRLLCACYYDRKDKECMQNFGGENGYKEN